MRVLVVEDEHVLADTIAEWLREDTHAVDTAYDGAAALERAGVNDYDVIILDRDLPAVHGDDVCRQLVETGSSARVLMLPAAVAGSDRVAGLCLGADDSLTRPCALPELAARVWALGRRSPAATAPILPRADITLDPARHQVFRDSRYVPLSKKEFAALTELMRADGATVSAEHLLEKVWDEFADPFTGAVRLTILKLRRKLGPPPVIETVRGVGYRIP